MGTYWCCRQCTFRFNPDNTAEEENCWEFCRSVFIASLFYLCKSPFPCSMTACPHCHVGRMSPTSSEMTCSPCYCHVRCDSFNSHSCWWSQGVTQLESAFKSHLHDLLDIESLIVHQSHDIISGPVFTLRDQVNHHLAALLLIFLSASIKFGLWPVVRLHYCSDQRHGCSLNKLVVCFMLISKSAAEKRLGSRIIRKKDTDYYHWIRILLKNCKILFIH